MSLDLYQRETDEWMMTLAPVQAPEPSAFDGFLRGTGMYAMRVGAQAGRAVSMAGATIPIAIDAITGGTELQERYFRTHDEIFGNAVDYWTPEPGEVGAAGEVVGTLLGSIPLLIASPYALIGVTQLSITEDLARKGVSADKAIAVGAAQAAGLGVGIYMPIFGKSLWQRMLLGGAGFNVVQGAAMRGVSELILEDTAAEGQFQAFDPTALTIDFLLGLGFGAITHLSPKQRAEGERFWNRMVEWGGSFKADEIESLMTLRHAQHTYVDSLPGKPVDIADMDAHVERLKVATEQLLRDQPVDVSDVPSGRFEPVPERWIEANARAESLLQEADRVRAEEGLSPPPDPEEPAPRVEPPPRVVGEIPKQPSVLEAIYAKRTADMTPDEMRIALTRDTLTGIKNRRAYNEMDPLPIKGTIDADGLKWVNDTIGHQAGDDLLRTIATVLDDETPHAFRFGGDEFAIQARTAEEARNILERATERLKDIEFMWELPDGTIIQKKGAYFSYGIGQTEAEAEIGLKAHKAERARAGIRRERGGEPEGVVRIPPSRKPSTKYKDPAKEIGRLDPLEAEVQRFISENPDAAITIGRAADGEPITKSLREFIDEMHLDADKIEEGVGLLEIAADCLIGKL